ncbi:hypothetical protein G5C51_26690 [Streptomyces sp. A7024]|uniref:Secreted protein n=1 Tax=Streptomyces coryli TaxID=1128680 RepID=A0A6G4U5G5_9ACTN|nr:DUF6049 family protein [Streptomyces coryli]NGN67479.1 hypothetical protein [Streptomyces coryli]
MPARPWTARRRLAAAVLLGLAVLAGLVQLPSAPPAQAQGEVSRSVDVSIDKLTPTVPAEGDTVTVSGKLTNRTAETITDAHAALRVVGPLDSRSTIAQARERNGFSQQSDGTEIESSKRNVGSLAPGVSEPFKIRISVGKLGLDRGGVYQLAASVSAPPAGGGYQRVVGIDRTFLPWQEAAREQRTNLSFMWPLISEPHLTARTEADDEQTPVFKSDALERQLRPGGRLQQLVSLGADLPVTWVIDPDLLAGVDAMREGYSVQTEDGKTVPGKGQAVAKAWLAQLEEALDGREVVALPFGDTDVASLAHNGEKVAGSLDHLKNATEMATTTFETVLPGVKPRTDFAWPVEGAIDPAIVNTATSAGARNIIARSDSLKEAGGLPYTPSASRPIGGGRTAVVADSRLSRLFEGDMNQAEESSVAVQEFLAQTQMITLQQPNRERSIVVAPQRTPTASQAQTMAAAVDGLSDSLWTDPQNLARAAKAEPDPRANRTVPGASAYPNDLRRQEIPTRTFQQIQETQGKVQDFQQILDAPGRVVTPFTTAILRELSNQWRGDPNGATAYRENVSEYLKELTNEVQLVDKSDLTLSGRSGTIPVTVQNKLLQDVKGLRLELRSSSPKRLDVSKSQWIEVGGGHSTTVKFDTEAFANGPVEIEAQLYTADGQTFGEAKTFTVEVTSITSTVLLVIGVGILLLVLAGVRMYTARKRRAAAEDAEPEEDGPEAGGPEARQDEGPEDPGSDGSGDDDTGPESGAPSGAGEKVDR